jgi:protein-S-isoprenylcysteine O-methyltransferase Ste14
LRSGFFGNVEPVLDSLITDGPYKFCRHPLYFSFILLVFGFDLLLGSIIGIVYTVVISIPTAIYRGKAEERSLKTRFGEEWDNYADKVGFLLPKFREHQKI